MDSPMDHTHSNNGKASKPPDGWWVRISEREYETLTQCGDKAFAIYLALKFFANPDGCCHPGQDKIASRVRVSERTVRDYIHRFCQHGLMSVQKRSAGRGGGRQSNRYQFLQPEAGRTSSNTTGSQLPLATVTTGSTAHLQPEAASSGELDPRTRPSKEERARRNFIEMWNSLPEGVPSQRIRNPDKPPKELITKWRTRWKDPELREWMSDPERTREKILKAKFIHGNAHFTLQQLLAHNGAGEVKLLKLVNGAYDHVRNGRSGKQASGPTRGKTYDPSDTQFGAGL